MKAAAWYTVLTDPLSALGEFFWLWQGGSDAGAPGISEHFSIHSLHISEQFSIAGVF